jgi:hypothetical protein
MNLKEENRSDTSLVVGSLRVLGETKGGSFTQFRQTIDELRNAVVAVGRDLTDFYRDIIADGSITPTEKQTLKRELEVIRVEVEVTKQAAFESGAQPTDELIIDYQAAFEALNDYMLDNHIFANMSEVSTITDRNAFIALWEQYNTAFQNLQYAIQNNILESITNGSSSSPDPSMPIVSAAAGQDGINLLCTQQGSGLGNIIETYTFFLSKDSGDHWTQYQSPSLDYFYMFDRSVDGYPEASDLSSWRAKVKTTNRYSKESVFSDTVFIDVSTYGTWIPTAPTQVAAQAEQFGLSLTWHAEQPLNLYGSVEYLPVVTYNTADRAGLDPTAELSYFYRFNRSLDGYPEKQSTSIPSNMVSPPNPPRLNLYSVSIKAVNVLVPNQLPVTSATVSVNDTGYGTWIPPIPTCSLTTGGRTIQIITSGMGQYGAAGTEFQVNKAAPTSDLTWYAPAFPDIVTAQNNVSSWKGASGGTVWEKGGQLNQIMPLEGQDISIPVNTTYQYRMRAVTVGEDGAVLYQGEWSAIRTALATATSPLDIAANAIGTAQLKTGAITHDKIAAHEIYTENLNVTARNIINPFLEGTAEGWWQATSLTTPVPASRVVEVSGVGKALSVNSGQDVASDAFIVAPDDLFEIKFGVSKSASDTTGLRLLAYGENGSLSVVRYRWNTATNQWELYNSSTASGYFNEMSATHSGVKYWTTYLFGQSVDIGQVPGPAFTDTTYYVFAVKLQSTTPLKMRIRAESNATAYLIRPQIYRVGDGKVIANSIVAKEAITAMLKTGIIYGDDNHVLSLMDGATKPGTTQQIPKGTFLLGAKDDTSSGASYMRRWYENGIWNFALRVASFVVSSIGSKVYGTFEVLIDSISRFFIDASTAYIRGTDGVNKVTVDNSDIQLKRRVCIEPVGNSGQWDQGLRIKGASGAWVVFCMGSTSLSGSVDSQWDFCRNPNNNLVICHNASGEEDGLTLYKNGANPTWKSQPLFKAGDSLSASSGTFSGSVAMNSSLTVSGEATLRNITESGSNNGYTDTFRNYEYHYGTVNNQGVVYNYSTSYFHSTADFNSTEYHRSTEYHYGPEYHDGAVNIRNGTLYVKNWMITGNSSRLTFTAPS